MEFLNLQLFTSGDGTVVTVGQVGFAVLVFLIGLIVTYFVSSIARKKLAATRLGANAANVLTRVVFYSMLVAVALTVLSMLHIPLTALAFLSGAVAIGLGFGAQAVINNFISGWILMTTQPVRIGDFVEVDGSFGTIEDVGNRSTRIRRVDGVHLLVPNSLMLERMVINWTLVDKTVRTSVRVGVAYGSPVRDVERLLSLAVSEHPSVLDDPAPVIFFDDFGDNALAFEVMFWCDVSGERVLRQVRSDLRYRIDELFTDAGIVIAFPQRDVHLTTARPLEIHVTRDQAKRS